MLRKISELEDYNVYASDGEIGSIKGFYFEEGSWKVHYILLDTGKWLPGRKVVISTEALNRIDHTDKALHIGLTKDRIKSSPEVNEDEPLSLDYVSRLGRHYGWSEAVSERLQNSHEVTGFYIEARDGDIGHVEDFLVDDDEWMIRYIIVDTRNWWPGKKVLVSPDWIESVRWRDKKVHVDMSRDQIKNAPEYSGDIMPDRSYEERLASHYGHAGYWTTGARRKERYMEEEIRR